MTTQYFRSRLSSLRDYLTPINHNSTFQKTGEITPEEFVKAGDYLVYRFPTWQWSPADPSKTKDYLPHDKQFLVTRHVPSYVRASDYELTDNDLKDIKIKIDSDDIDDEETWTSTDSRPVSPKLEADESSIKEISDEEEDDINDIDELIDETAEDVEFDDNLEQAGNNNNNNNNNNKFSVISGNSTINKFSDKSMKRNYDLYITYSTSYRVPKMYLVGFDSNSVPLTPKQMFEDIASDYRNKTVTIEKLPFLSNTTSVSIHPCKHANVMKILMKRASDAAIEKHKNQESEKLSNHLKTGKNQHDENDDDDWENIDNSDQHNFGIRVDQYLIVFLKFISSVTPGIEHDYTMEAL